MQAHRRSFFSRFLYLSWVTLLFVGGCQQKQRTTTEVRHSTANSDCIKSPITENTPFDILDREDIIIEEDPVERITIMVHGTNLPLIAAERYAPSWCASALTAWLDSSRGLKLALSCNHVYEGLAKALHAVAPYQFPLEHFYFFDWSGKLTFHDRKQAAQELYEAISALFCDPQYNNAHVTLIGYSHGGNVAVNLGCVAETEKNKQLPGRPVHIDRLVLLGCPVQEMTQRYVTSRVFKHVYHLYTHADLVQVMDTQTPLDDAYKSSWYSSFAFSGRTFDPDTSPNLVQAKITRNNRSLYHKDFVTPSFFGELPTILCTLEHELLRETLPRTQEGIYHVDCTTRARKKRRKRHKKLFSRNVRRTMVTKAIGKEATLC